MSLLLNKEWYADPQYREETKKPVKLKYRKDFLNNMMK
jgi:hypothetical protein